jgi:hypothetical protein
MRTLNEATGRHWRLRHIAVRALMVFAMAVAIIGSTTSVASAAGDAAVDNLIVKNALPGWSRLPEVALLATVESERSAMRAATDHDFEVAVDGWQQSRQQLLVVLISFPNHDAPGSFKPRDAVVGACGASTRKDPQGMHSFFGIAGSTEARCVGASSTGFEIDAAVMSWQKEDTFALVIGSRFSEAQLEQFAVTQDAALPGPVNALRAPDSDSGSSMAGVIVVIVIIVVMGGGVGFLLIARSRSNLPMPVQALGGSPGTASPAWTPSASASGWSPPAQSPGFGTPASFGAPTAPSSPVATVAQPPGWQPVEGDPTRIAYWDGSSFTAWKHWDGSSWVD